MINSIIKHVNLIMNEMKQNWINKNLMASYITIKAWLTMELILKIQDQNLIKKLIKPNF